MPTQRMTAESVTEGHPDKVADQISDVVLDAVLREDPHGRVACETVVAAGLVAVVGEITAEAMLQVPTLAREVIARIGYTDPALGFDAETCGVIEVLSRQSPEIAAGVSRSLEARSARARDRYDLQGAGDQGVMIGYAVDETPELMPLPLALAHDLCRALAAARRGGMPELGPDGKAQATVAYRDGRPAHVETVVVSTQHRADVPPEELRPRVEAAVVAPVLAARGLFESRPTVHVNPAGTFVTGGPRADCGLTGRKLGVDTYGGLARYAGGALSGKDPSKVDRSGAYAARWVAKNVVAAGLARRCEVSVAYAIGVAHPVAVDIECFGTERRPAGQILRWIGERFDLRPAAIVEELDLLRPIYTATAAYGHFGREEPEFTWERVDRAHRRE